MSNGTCLVVDDSSVVRKILKGILTELNFEIREAADGQQALDSSNEVKPDLVMLDWNMPVMDGMEFLKKFREQDAFKEVTVVFCTTENDITKIMLAMEAGANEYIMKPFDAEIVKTKLMQLGILSD